MLKKNFLSVFSLSIVLKTVNKYKIILFLVLLVLLILVYAFYTSWHGLHNQLVCF